MTTACVLCIGKQIQTGSYVLCVVNIPNGNCDWVIQT